MMRLINKKAQNTAEYAILIALIVAVAVAMQTYVKRGLQGRFKDATDKLAIDTGTIGSTGQYEPYYLESNFESTRNVLTREEEMQGGAVGRNFERDTVERTGHQTYNAPQSAP